MPRTVYSSCILLYGTSQKSLLNLSPSPLVLQSSGGTSPSGRRSRLIKAIFIHRHHKRPTSYPKASTRLFRPPLFDRLLFVQFSRLARNLEHLPTGRLGISRLRAALGTALFLVRDLGARRHELEKAREAGVPTRRQRRSLRRDDFRLGNRDEAIHDGSRKESRTARRGAIDKRNEGPAVEIGVDIVVIKGLAADEMVASKLETVIREEGDDVLFRRRE